MSEICSLIFTWQIFSPVRIIFKENADSGKYFCRIRRPPFNVFILVNFTWAIVRHTSLRQLKMFGQVKTLMLTSLSGLYVFRRPEVYTKVPPTTEVMDVTI